LKKHNVFIGIRVARWHIFEPKIPIGVNFEGSCNGRGWFIMWHVGVFYGYLVYFVTIWYILWLFGIFYRFGILYLEKIWQP
jgi:hypothetical protein